MTPGSFLLTVIMLYLLYRFIVGFVLPVVRTTSHVRQQVNAMKEQMQNQQNPYSQTQNSNGGNGQGRTSIKATDQKPKYDMEGEYIKFEEVKD